MEEMFKPAWSTEVISEYKWKRFSKKKPTVTHVSGHHDEMALAIHKQ